MLILLFYSDLQAKVEVLIENCEEEITEKYYNTVKKAKKDVILAFYKSLCEPTEHGKKRNHICLDFGTDFEEHVEREY